MTILNCSFITPNTSEPICEETQSAYNTLFLLTGVALSMIALAKFLESQNQLHFENRSTRIITGFLTLIMRMHTKSGDLEIINTPDEGKLIAVGPHRTGWEAVVLASKIRGTPPRFFATDMFNVIPGMATLMNRFKVIPIEAKSKSSSEKTANAQALEKASQALQEHGCVALFPQGGFSKMGEEPRRVYDGAAKLALMNNIAIHVIRLDGYWCLTNPLIPLFIRNNTYYRAFLSSFHMNNVRVTPCGVIDCHLKPEHKDLTDEQKIEEINARLYAYYRHTEELTVEQIHEIDSEILENKHLPIWREKVEQDKQQKALKLKDEDTFVVSMQSS